MGATSHRHTLYLQKPTLKGTPGPSHGQYIAPHWLVSQGDAEGPGGQGSIGGARTFMAHKERKAREKITDTPSKSIWAEQHCENLGEGVAGGGVQRRDAWEGKDTGSVPDLQMSILDERGWCYAITILVSLLASLCKQDGILLDRFCRTSYGFLLLKSGGRRTIHSKWVSTKRNDLMYNQYDM